MRTILLSHNKVAYQKVMKSFETSDRTCVVHPTGTGKSYLIAAVSESFKNVLVLGPNIFVLEQVHDVLSWRKQGVEYMTYSLLMYKKIVPTGYDLICLDEFHRAGAPEWGEAVDRLLEENPQAKVLGTTATPIRFLDDSRDMADELFGGNIASYMSLKDAFDRDILATPRFVTGLFEFDKVADEAIERINKSKILDKEAKRQRLTRISNLRLDWERSQGMPQIIRKHIDKDARRIIVFCGNIEKLKEMEQTVCGWFQAAGIRIAGVYRMHAYMPDSELKMAMDGFESDDFGEGGVKLIMSVNMLNEGVHIPRVNAVILLRTTSSKIIYLQQIGRCLTADKKDKPIILDMVDNITTTNILHDIREGYDWYEHQTLKEAEERGDNKPRNFVVYDYTLGIQDAIKKLVPNDYKRLSFSERYDILLAFCEKYGRLPEEGDPKEDLLNWHNIRVHFSNRQEIIDLRNKYGIIKSKEFRYEQLMRFLEAHNRLPRIKQEPKEYRNFFTLYSLHKREPDERMQRILDKYRRKKYTAEEILQQLIAFVKEHNRLPSGNYHVAPPEELKLRRHVREKLSNNTIARELIDRYTDVCLLSFEDRVAKLKAFVDKNDRLPNKSEREENNNLSNLYRLRKKRPVNHTLEEIINKYKQTYTDDEVKQRVLDFFAENGRLPYKSKSREESSLCKLFRDHRDPLYKDPDIIPLLATRKKQRSFNDAVQMMIDYTNKNGCRPSRTDQLYNMWIRVVSRRDTDPRCMELYNKYGGREATRMKEYIKPLEDYIHTHKHLPSTKESKEENHLYSILVNIRKKYYDHPDVKPLLDEISSLPTPGDARRARNDKEVKRKIIAFVDEYNRLPRYGKDNKEENSLAKQWSARRDRLCMDDPVMQAILDQYDTRPMKFEERYAAVRDWAASNGRLPRKTDGDIYQTYDMLRRSYYNVPEVSAMLAKYCARSARPKVDIDLRLDQIEAFADEHGRLPSTAHGDELLIARRWQSIKRRYGQLDRVVSLIERFPIQNRKR